jgi:hypothetical protein
VGSGRVVLVDAENVRRSRWPNVPGARLVELCAGCAEREGVRCVVVFDGAPPGGERELGALLVTGSGAGSADDRLVEEAERAVRANEVWLASSDRELRARTAHTVARVVGGGSFLQELLEGGN